MPASLIHLARHGEVNNPDGVLYGRLGGFGLTDRGHKMAGAVGKFFQDRPVSAVLSSPLTRATQTADAIADATGCTVTTDDRVIEGANQFEGSRVSPQTLLANLAAWPKLWNPFRPSWGEAYRSVAERMMAAMAEASDRVDSGEVVVVSHQLPIWVMHLQLAGISLHHSPRKRRCSLCSVTSFQQVGSSFVEVSYVEPAKVFADSAVDLGAV
jgi:broad specificity phosphatase PhoE